MTAAQMQEVQPEHIELARMFTSVKVMGPPMSEKLVSLIAHLFNRDEARIGMHLSFIRPKTAEQVARKARIPQETTTGLLDDMCRKRIIITVARRYMLYPLIPGTFEHILRTGDGSEWHYRYAKLINDLIDTGYLRDYFTRPVNAIRNIPVQRAVQDKSFVAGADLVSEMIDSHSDFAVFHTCPCRQSMHLTGHSCERAAPTDGCLTFGEFSLGVEASGNGRCISKSEMHDIVAERIEKKLVFFTSNAVPSLQTAICTCCDCCCHALGIINAFGGKLMAPSHFTAAVEDPLCVHCGNCVKACRTHAHSMAGREHVYHSQKCIGCGNCAMACKKNAISMIENKLYRPPYGSYKKLIIKMIPPVILTGIGIKLRRYFRDHEVQ